MPIRRVKGGWKWGGKGHVYPTRAGAERQAAAAHANGYQGKAKGGVVEKEKKKSPKSATKPDSKESKA